MLRQGRAELTLPPAEAEKARAVYEITEWTAELEERWIERKLYTIGWLTKKLPAGEWEWAWEQVQDRKRRKGEEPALAHLVEVLSTCRLPTRSSISCGRRRGRSASRRPSCSRSGST